MSVVPYTGGGASSNRALSVSRLSNRDYGECPLTIRGSRRSLLQDDIGSSFLGSGITDIMKQSRSMFGQMNRMMESMIRDPFREDPFFNSAGSLPSLLDDPSQRRPAMRDPFFMNPMSIMAATNMNDMTRDPNCHMFSSSSVMTMTTGPDGNPQVYQASTSSRAVPGGVKETRQSVSDSRTGLRKMAIGHHIEDKSHIIEREMKNGELEERQELVNLDEDDVPTFDTEFKRRTQRSYGASNSNSLEYRHRRRPSPSSPVNQQRSTYLPALPASSSSYKRRSRPHLAISGESSRSQDRQRYHPGKHNRGSSKQN